MSGLSELIEEYLRSRAEQDSGPYEAQADSSVDHKLPEPSISDPAPLPSQASQEWARLESPQPAPESFSSATMPSDSKSSFPQLSVSGPSREQAVNLPFAPPPQPMYRAEPAVSESPSLWLIDASPSISIDMRSEAEADWESHILLLAHKDSYS